SQRRRPGHFGPHLERSRPQPGATLLGFRTCTGPATDGESSMHTPSHDTLRRQRAAHLDNLERLKNASYQGPTHAVARGEATMANLMQQVYDIDAQLEQLERGGHAASLTTPITSST